MPFLVLLVLGWFTWRFANRFLQSKEQDRLLLEARVGMLEREVSLLREQLEKGEEILRLNAAQYRKRG